MFYITSVADTTFNNNLSNLIHLDTIGCVTRDFGSKARPNRQYLKNNREKIQRVVIVYLHPGTHNLSGYNCHT